MSGLLRNTLIVLAGLIGAAPTARGFPSPTYQDLTVLGTCTGCGGGGGNVFGPGFSSTGHIATWGNTSGTNLLDGGALGTSATTDIGTSGATIPLNNGNNSLSGNNIFSGASTFQGTINLSSLSASTVLCTDASRNVVSGGCVPASGNVIGPGSSAVGHIATFNNTGGTLLADGGALGTAATVNTGTSGATIPLLNTANTWSLAQTFTLAPIFTAAPTLSSIISAGCLGTDGSGVIQVGTCGGGGGGGNVTGPGTSVVGHVATYGNTSGTSITDGGALGTAATANTGTSGATLGLNNANKTDSGNNTYSGTNSFGNTVTLSALTASSSLCTDASKNVVTSNCPGPSGFHTPSITGTAFGTGATLAGTDARFFTITVGTGLVATTSAITFSPAATTAITCQVEDVTTTSADIFITHQVGAGTTSSVTIGNFSNLGTPEPWLAGDKLNITCQFR